MSSIWNPNTVPTFYAQPGINVTVTNLAAARLVPAIFPSVTTLGYYTPGDGGDGTYNVVTTAQVDNGGTFITGADGVTKRKLAGAGGQVNVAQWGCINGVDSTARLQVAENWMTANGGGELIIPNGFTLMAAALQFQSGVSYRGMATLSSTSAFAGTSIMQVAAGGEIFGYTTARCTGKRFSNLMLQGNGAVAGNLRGFWCGKDNTMGNVAAPFAQYAALANHSCERFTYENVALNNFRQEAIMEEQGSGTYMLNVWSQNILQDLTYLTSQRGGVTSFMSDGRYTDCEFGGLPANNGNKVTSTNLYQAGFWLAGKSSRAKSFVNGTVGEQSDIGLLIDQVGAHLVNCRGDQNNGVGISIRWTNVNVSGGQCWNNSRDTNNLYDGFVVESTADSCRVDNVESICQTSISNSHRYAFRDDVGRTAVASRTRFDNCLGVGFGTAEYFATSPLSAGAFFTTNGSPSFLSTNNVAPAINGITNAATNNTAATVYSNFTGGYPNQTLRILILDGNTSFGNGATLKTTTGATVVATASSAYEFQERNGIWYMIN